MQRRLAGFSVYSWNKSAPKDVLQVTILKFWRSPGDSAQERFNRDLLPHLDSAFNFARWLSRNEDDAADITQEAMIKAFKNLDQMKAGSAKAWLMAIVRHTGLTYLNRKSTQPGAFLDESKELEWQGFSPEQALLMSEEKEVAMRLLEELPTEFREVVILRDVEDLSYKEISEVVGAPIGTVMSRLNRARYRLQQRLSDRTPEERRLGL